uniref:Uncharacterized protein n=1 Tax=Nicotiana tabacum TaxID=4097 RepID=A0A1S3XS61_TOBAC|nr:PREDICTED: uncharacterized protein LOC107767916 [Nicotiana tabacum]
MKGEKLVNEEVVPPPLVDIDDELNEEPSSLICKSSKKPTVPKSREESSVRMMEFSNVEVEKSSEKVVEEYGKKVSEKSAEKGKCVRKSVKRKAGANEEPGSTKKAKVGVAKDERRENLRNQKVMWGRTFAPNILDIIGMHQLVDICEFQQVRSFYADMFTVEDDNICLKVNGVDFVMNEVVLGTILGVPTGGISSIEGTYSSNFRSTILKYDAVQQGERVHKKALLLMYQLLVKMVNKVFLPRTERHSITSREDMFLMEALDAYSTINLPGIMIEHMKKVADFKDGNHGLPYGFLLTKVFEFFKVPLGKATVGTRMKTFSKTTLEEYECIDKKGGVGRNSTISQLIEAQNIANEEIRKLKAQNVIL